MSCYIFVTSEVDNLADKQQTGNAVLSVMQET